MLMPPFPPSPKKVTNQLGLGVLSPPPKAWVPLSCVPPMIWLSGFCIFRERLWNWSVARPAFIEVIVVGTFDSQLLQSIRLFPVIPRDAHWLWTSVNEPSNRQTPPSFAINTIFGLNGVAAIAC